MNTVTTMVPYGPTITVHRGWAPIKSRNGARRGSSPAHKRHYETSSLSHPSSTGGSLSSQPEDEEIPKEERAASNRESSQRIEFVNATEPSLTKNPAVRKRVRSHVMKGVARERRELKKSMLKGAEDQCLALSPLPKPHSPGGNRHPVPLPGGNRTREPLIPAALTSTVSPQAIAQEIQWRFSAFPNTYTPNTHKLATLYFDQFATAMYPIEYLLTFNPVKTQSRFEFCMSDDVIFHGILYAAAVSSSLFNGEKESSDITIQMGRTMALVNKRLAGAEGEGTSDAVIGAVTRLAIGEALRGHYENWAIHMAGLKNMVGLKGGLSNVDICLRTMLHSADMSGAIDQLVPPFFQLDWSERTAPTYEDPCFLKKPRKPKTFGLLRKYIPPALASVLKELRDFSHILEHTFESGSPKFGTGQFIRSCYLLQHQLLIATLTQTQDEKQGPLETAFGVAGLIYMKLILREIHHITSGSKILVHKLKESLGLVLDNGTSSSAMIWPLCMGGLASKNRLDRTWFVAHLVKIAGTLGVETWEGLKAELDRVVWFSRMIDAGGRGLWQEVEVTRSVLVGS